MNLAFSALTLAILLAPGYVLLLTYLGGPHGLERGPSTPYTITFRLLLIGLASVLMHLALVPLVHTLELGTVSFRGVAIALIGRYDDTAQDTLVTALTADPVGLAGYFFAAVAVAAVPGGSIRRLVRSNKLDLRLPLLKFGDHWFYAFSGRNMLTPDATEHILGGVYVSALTSVGNDTVIYDGAVADWEYDSNGRLDYIVMDAVEWVALDDWRAGQSPAPMLPGRLVINWADISNLQIRYVLESVGSGEGDD